MRNDCVSGCASFEDDGTVDNNRLVPFTRDDLLLIYSALDFYRNSLVYTSDVWQEFSCLREANVSSVDHAFVLKNFIEGVLHEDEKGFVD